VTPLKRTVSLKPNLIMQALLNIAGPTACDLDNMTYDFKDPPNLVSGLAIIEACFQTARLALLWAISTPISLFQSLQILRVCSFRYQSSKGQKRMFIVHIQMIFTLFRLPSLPCMDTPHILSPLLMTKEWSSNSWTSLFLLLSSFILK
jgi:hypothetical protein